MYVIISECNLLLSTTHLHLSFRILPLFNKIGPHLACLLASVRLTSTNQSPPLVIQNCCSCIIDGAFLRIRDFATQWFPGCVMGMLVFIYDRQLSISIAYFYYLISKFRPISQALWATYWFLGRLSPLILRLNFSSSFLSFLFLLALLEGSWFLALEFAELGFLSFLLRWVIDRCIMAMFCLPFSFPRQVFGSILLSLLFWPLVTRSSSRSGCHVVSPIHSQFAKRQNHVSNYAQKNEFHMPTLHVDIFVLDVSYMFPRIVSHVGHVIWSPCFLDCMRLFPCFYYGGVGSCSGVRALLTHVVGMFSLGSTD